VTRDELDARLARARDPTLIPGIYNYCLRRCGRCPFTGRCLLYRDDQEAARRGDGEFAERIGRDLQDTADHVRALCTREDLDSPGYGDSRPDVRADCDLLDASTTADESIADAPETRLNADVHAIDSDLLCVAAERYEAAAYAIVDPLRHLSPFHEWPRDVGEALDTISWNAGAIRAKLFRALCGQAECGGDDDERLPASPRFPAEAGTPSDPVQNDWNGSAKVTRLAIAESIAAWDVLYVAGETPYDAPIRQRRCELEEMDDEIARRFPHAMSFMRPGFDDPDVAPSTLRSAAPFEPRRVTFVHRIKRWFAARFQR
jgi:hypothetical protein